MATRSLSCKGGDDMVTYDALFVYTMVIVAVVTLCYTLFNNDNSDK